MHVRRTAPLLFWLAAIGLLAAACGDAADRPTAGDGLDGRDARPAPSDQPDWTLNPSAEEPREPALVGRPALPEPGDAVVRAPERPETELPASPTQAEDPLATPIAVPRARVDDGGVSAWSGELDVPALTRIQLDGTESTGRHDIVDWEWWLMEYPLGGLRAFEPNAEHATPTFFITTAGTYQIALRVQDETGVESDVGVLKITAGHSAGIVVELTWHTPADVNPLDTGGGRGSDVDLHLLHPNGTWNQAPWDCSWTNKNPSWGEPGPSDDPALDIDDTDGWGPETVRLDAPQGTVEAPVVYSVGAFYFSDHGFDESHVTIRIFIDGAERFVETRESLENRQFWHAADITWPSGAIDFVDGLHPSGFP